MIKCTATHCSNNKDCKCLLDEISMFYNWDIESATCEQFKESVISRRQKFEIKQLNNGSFLAIQTTIVYGLSSYIQDIREYLIEEFPSESKYVVYIDTLASCYSASTITRFLKLEFSKDNKDNNVETHFISRYTILGDEVRETTCNYFRETFGSDLNLLSSTITKMIKKGLNI